MLTPLGETGYLSFLVFLQYIIMVKATEYNLRRTAKRKGILGHQNKSNKELLRIIYKLKRITENLFRNGLKKKNKNAKSLIKWF